MVDVPCHHFSSLIIGSDLITVPLTFWYHCIVPIAIGGSAAPIQTKVHPFIITSNHKHHHSQPSDGVFLYTFVYRITRFTCASAISLPSSRCSGNQPDNSSCREFTLMGLSLPHCSLVVSMSQSHTVISRTLFSLVIGLYHQCHHISITHHLQSHHIANHARVRVTAKILRSTVDWGFSSWSSSSPAPSHLMRARSTDHCTLHCGRHYHNCDHQHQSIVTTPSHQLPFSSIEGRFFALLTSIFNFPLILAAGVSNCVSFLEEVDVKNSSISFFCWLM